MTVTMTWRGPNSTALVSDLVVGQDNGDGAYDFSRTERSKIRHVGGRVFAAVAGDEVFAWSIGWLGEWLQPRVLDLHDKRACAAVVEGVAKLRTLKNLVGKPRKGATVFVADGARVFLWRSEPSVGLKELAGVPYELPQRYEDLVEGEAAFNWFGKVERVHFEPGDDITAKMLSTCGRHAAGLSPANVGPT